MPSAFHRLIDRHTASHQCVCPEAIILPAGILCQRSTHQILLAMLLLLAAFPARVNSADPVTTTGEPEAAGVQAVVVAESAVYTGDVHDLEITAGEMTLDVVRRGQIPGFLDWSDVSVALNQLRWDQQTLIAGTTPQQKMVIFTSQDRDRLHGRWSGHGQSISQKAVFDLVLPAALNTRLVLRLAPALMMESSQGILTPAPQLVNGKREWTLELGHLNATTLTVGPASNFQRSASPRYEIETEHRARRDGIFLRSDITIDGRLPEKTPLLLSIPAAVEIQSVTIFSGSVQVGATLAFSRDPAQPDIVRIPLETLNLESRLTLRLRGFQPVTWGQPHLLPVVVMTTALETRRSVVIRVEPPLQLQSVDVHGMLQTSLTSEEAAGEVWKFEAREPDSRLSVVIDLPRSGIVADMNCLAEARRASGWAAAVLSMHVENGSRFNATLLLPDDWKLVSVAAGDAESRLTSWTVDQRQLHVIWQNPMTPTSRRQLLLFARTPAWKTEAPVRLQIPQLRQAESLSVQYQILLPSGMDLQVVEGEGWRQQDNAPIASPVLRLREVSERLPDARLQSCVTLKSNNEARGNRTLVSLIPRSQNSESLSAEGTPEQSSTSGSTPAETPAPATRPQEENEPPETLPGSTLQILSMSGPSQDRGCVHHVEMQFDQPIDPHQMNLTLPTSCKVSAVEVDGRSVTVFRNGPEIPLPSEMPPVSRLSLTYMTPPGTGWLYQNTQVPLPQTSSPVEGVSWTLDLPRDQRLASIQIPGVMSVTEADRNFSRQYFGPLTRRPSDRIFNPFTAQDWGELIESNRTSASTEPNRRVLQFLAPTAGQEIEFVTWDSAVTRHVAWVSLLGCLMIGAAARLFRIEWLRHLGAIWLVLLLGAILLSPSAWTLIIGGMFTGSLLSLLIPRHWMQKRDILRRSGVSGTPAQKLITATAILLTLSILRGPATSLGADEKAEPPAKKVESPQTPPAGKQPAPPPKEKAPSVTPSAIPREDAAKASAPEKAPEKTASALPDQALRDAVYPSYLIESARYELDRLLPTPQFRMTLIVRSQPSPHEIFVRLPLQDVILPPSAECLVNGEKKILIPSVSGDVIMVGLNTVGINSVEKPGKTPGGTGPETPGWIRSEIQLTFMIRSTSSPNEMEPMLVSFQAVVPKVLDSTLQVPAKLLSFPFGRWGEVVSQGAESALLYLGGIGKLRSSFQSSGPVDALGAGAVTSLDVTPLRFKGQTRIIPGPNGWPSQLPLSFPPGCVISSISGNSLIDFVDAPTDSAATSVTLRLRKGIPAAPVIVNFELPGGPQNPTELTIPAFLLWKGVNMPHSIGISGPSTTSLSLVKTPGVVPLSPEEWPTDGDSGRARPALAVMLNSPQQVQLSWNQLNPVRSASIAEQLTIQQDHVAWSAQVQMNVSQITTFIHQFKIDPGIHIDSVTSQESGTDKSIRSNRTGNILSIFLPGGQLGNRTFQLTGKAPLTVDAWTPIPAIEALQTTVTEAPLTILDKTGWNLELESAPGTPIDLSARPAGPAAAAGAGRMIGVFRRDSGPRPQRFRVAMPPEATRADSVLLLRQAAGHWEAITTFHLTALEAGMKKAVFHIPREMTGVHIRPSLFQYVATTDENGTLVTVKIPDRYSGSTTLTISARISPNLPEETEEETTPSLRENLPLIEVLSAQKASQFVLVDQKSLIVPAPTGSLRIDAAAFPAWAPAEWVRGVKDRSLVCYQQIRKDLTIVSKAASELSGRPSIQLEETVIWPQEQGGYRGLTRLWMTAKDEMPLSIAHQPHLIVTSVTTTRNEPVQWSQTDTGTSLTLTRQAADSGIVIQWTSRAADRDLALLQFTEQAPQHRLLGIASPDHWKFIPKSVQPENRLQIWLTRWAALLECLRETVGPVPVDGLLMHNIRQCQSEAGALLQQGTPADHQADQQEFRRLSSAWSSLKNDLIISSDQEPQQKTPFSSAFTELLSQGQSGLQMQWVIPASSSLLGRFEQLSPPDFRQQLLWYGVLAILISVVMLRGSRRLRQLRESLSLRPVLSLTILGLLWWLFLSPSVAGVLLVVLAWTWGLCSWLIGLWKRFRRPAATPA